MRDCGAFLQLAQDFVRILVPGDPEIEVLRRGQGWPACSELTPPEELEKQFPITLEGTPYHLFSTTKKPVKAVVIVTNPIDCQEAVLREVALGMMDNPIYH